MKYINSRIEKVCKSPGLYIGNKSLESLSTFLSGYECALNTVLEDFPYFDSKFQRFIENKYGLTFCTTHWSKIISANNTEEEAFDLFVKYWKEMNEEITTGISEDPVN